MGQDVPSRGVKVKEQHRVPWPEMVLGRGDPKPRQAKTEGNWLPSLPGTYPSLHSFVDRSRDPGNKTTVMVSIVDKKLICSVT